MDCPLLSEMYGCTGWDFDFRHKALTGRRRLVSICVVIICRDTMKGEAKRDYPASIFFQSAWWDQYKHVEDYYARLHVALTRGQCVQDILVVHPIESMFARFHPRFLDHDDPKKFMLFNTSEDVLFCDESLVSLRNMLLESHFDFAYGDEDIMARHGKVVVDDECVRFQVGACNTRLCCCRPWTLCASPR